VMLWCIGWQKWYSLFCNFCAQLTCGPTDFLPYVIDSDGKCIVVDNPGSLGESIGLKVLDKSPHTLTSHLKKLLKQVETTNR
jgi:hypothetical protein